METIGLQDVIEQVKSELLARNPAAAARDAYPLFHIDRIELEIETRISRSADGSVKLTVLDFELNAGGSTARERGHVVRLSLTPLLSREALLAEALKDERSRQIISSDSQRALLRGEHGLAGDDTNA